MTLANMIKKFGGEWVAINPDDEKVLSNNKSAKKVFKEAQKKGIIAPILFKVPTKYLPFIG